MRVEARHGTPSHLETHSYKTPSQAKNFLVGKIKDRERWGNAFNHEVERRLIAAREELDGLAVGQLKLGDVRAWEVVDDYTHVRFRFEIEKMEE